MSQVMYGFGLSAAAIFLITALTPISNYASAHFALGPSLQSSGAIVVLGAGVWKGGMLNSESMRRTLRGIELYKGGLASVMVLSGPPRIDEPDRSEAQIRADFAVTVGVPSSAIIKEDAVKTTREESVRISRILQSRGIHSILLVTESLHMRRSVYLFERAGMEVHPVPSDNLTVAAASPGERLDLAFRIFEETAALIYYRMAGYI